MTNAKTCEPDVKALADKLWRVHPKEIQDLGITRQQYYEREIGKLVSQLTAERDAARLAAQQNHTHGTEFLNRAVAAEQRAKELEEDRDLDKVVLDEGIEIINELEASSKLLSERVAVLEKERDDHFDKNIRLLASEGAAILRAERAEASLDPFVKYLKTFDDGGLTDQFNIVDTDGDLVCTVGDLRRARTALEGK